MRRFELRNCFRLCAGAMLGIVLVTPALAASLRVGPTEIYKAPCAAIAAASPGDVIEIAPVLYQNDSCAWQTNNLSLIGTIGPDGSRPHIDDSGMTGKGRQPHLAQYKGIWVPYGSNTVVENIEFSGAQIPAIDGNNGAGIRISAPNMTIRNCYFHNNQDGILESNIAGSHIDIEFSEFAYNGAGDGQSHNLYIGSVASLQFAFNYSHDAVVGHLLKSRAAVNYILYNRLTGENGTDSYEIDLPNGGTSYVIGNLIQQGSNTQNSTILTYLEEGSRPNNPGTDLYVVNNSFVNQYPSGTFVRVGLPPSIVDQTPALLQNNIFYGPGTVTNQTNAILKTNFVGDPYFVDLDKYDYHLMPDSPAINTGSQPGAANSNGFVLIPGYEYVHPACGQERDSVGIIDIGAYEFGDGGAMLPCR
jgi:Right handed beta helix region